VFRPTIQRRQSNILVLALALLLGQTAAVRAQRDDNSRSGPKILAAFREVVAKPSHSVVRVQCDGKEVALGTVVAADGLVLTKASLLSGKAACKLADGRVLEAKLLGVEEPHDLALLKIEAKGLMPIEWKAAKDSAPGDWVASVGTGKEPVAVGVVSVASRVMTAKNYPRIINPNGGFLGITLAPGDEDGVKVGSVMKDTGAEKAGLKAGDVILSVDGKRVKEPDKLQDLLGTYKAGNTVTVKFKRGKEEMELKVTLGKRPPDLARGEIQNRMGSQLSDRRFGFPHILQHDTVLKPAECGGPLVDLDGKAVGLNISRAGRTESYAIPSENVLALLPDLKSGKLAPKPISENVKKLEAAVADAEKRLEKAEKRSATAKALLKQAEEAKGLSEKDDPDAVAIHKRAVKLAQGAEKQLASARDALAKARAELKKAQAEVKK
jgi:serine protease Do